MNRFVHPIGPRAGTTSRRPRAVDAAGPPIRLRAVLRGVAGLGLCAVAIAGFAATADGAPAPGRPAAGGWGAIAARPDGHGYAFDQPSRADAERAALARCERPAGATPVPGPPSSSGRTGDVRACEVRVWFERGCGALATGNFGEWGAAVGADGIAATKAALARCDALLPTEPCRAVVSVCSRP